MIFKSLLEVIDPIDSVSLCLAHKDGNEIQGIFQSQFKWEIDRTIINKYWRYPVLYILVENDHCIQITVEEPKKDGQKRLEKLHHYSETVLIQKMDLYNATAMSYWDFMEYYKLNKIPKSSKHYQVAKCKYRTAIVNLESTIDKINWIDSKFYRKEF